MSRRFFAPLVVAAAVAGGGVAGAALGVPVLSGAQESIRPRRPRCRRSPTVRCPSRRRVRREVTAGSRRGRSAGHEREELVRSCAPARRSRRSREEKGVDVNTVIDAMVAKAVEAGRDEAEARERITALVNEGRPAAVCTTCAVAGSASSSMRRPRHSAWSAARSCRSCETARRSREVAEEQGVDVDTVIDAMVAPVRERITEFVNEGAPTATVKPHPRRRDAE